MTRAELLDHLAPSPAAREQAEAIFLADDLLQREALAAGEIDRAEPTVLSAAQARGEQPLPDALRPAAPEAPPRVAADALWAAYYRHAAEVARRHRSTFLGAWVGHEVALRNALAAARARALGLSPEEYLVASELGEDTGAADAAVGEWSAAGDPLTGLRVLDRHRWAWLDAHDAWFSFGADELAAYAARLILLHRWRRLETPRAEPATAGEA
jgi:hypothetical protein